MVSDLERNFQHIATALTRVWGCGECLDNYMDTLMLDTRHDRAGLPKETWKELWFLQALHSSIHPSPPRVEQWTFG